MFKMSQPSRLRTSVTDVMTIEEFNKNLGSVVTDLQSSFYSKVMPRIGAEALTLIKQRVQETGKMADGGSFPAYSTKPMLVGAKSFPTKEAQNKVFGKQKNKALNWVTIGEGEGAKRLAILQGGYRQWRGIMGVQVNHVDFMVSGRMWANINVISTPSDHSSGMAVIGAKEDRQKQKLAGNTARKGDILDLSKEELNSIESLYEVDLLKIFKDNGIQ